MRKNMFCFNLFGEEIRPPARLQGRKFFLVPTPRELHPVSHCLGAEQGSSQISQDLAVKPSCFWIAGHTVICKRAVGKMDKSFIEEEQKKNVTFCQCANKWKLIHPVQWVFVSAQLMILPWNMLVQLSSCSSLVDNRVHLVYGLREEKTKQKVLTSESCSLHRYFSCLLSIITQLCLQQRARKDC